MGQQDALTTTKVQQQPIETKVVQFSAFQLPKSQWTAEQHLLQDFMQLRRQVFADGKGWRVWLACTSDLDQYDQLDAYYIIAFEPGTGKVLAGCRLLRCDRGGATPGHHDMTYMVRDAVRGVLPGLPLDLCYEDPPCDAGIWELTRFASNGAPGSGAQVLARVGEFLVQQQARGFIFLSPPAVSRLAKPAGFTNVRALGPLRGERGGRFQVFSADLPSAAEEVFKNVV